jgi:hypothetical protein
MKTGPKAKLYTCNGKTLTLREWAQETGLSRACLTSRVRYGIPFDRGLHWHPIRERIRPVADNTALSIWLRSPIGANQNQRVNR